MVRSPATAYFAALLSIVCLVPQVCSSEELYRTSENIPFSDIAAKYPAAVSLFSSPAYNYTIRWGTNATHLNVVLALRTPFANASSVAQSQLFRPFLGFGFGRTMIGAQFVVCHFDPTYTKYKVHEHLPVSGYYPPTPVNDENWLAVRPLSGGFTENVIYCEWTRPFAPNTTYYTIVDPTVYSNVIWSFNLIPSYRAKDDNWFSYHGNKWRGALSVIFNPAPPPSPANSTDPGSGSNGNSQVNADAVLNFGPVSYTNKLIHGFGMAFVWIILFPSSVIISRYLRSQYAWLYWHMGVQLVGTTASFGLLTVIILTIPTTRLIPHTVIGIILLAITVIQVTIGVINLLGLADESLEKLRSWSKGYHAIQGAVLLLLAFVQVGIGLDMAFPIAEERGREAWYVYFFLVAFWVVIYTTIEVYVRIRVRRINPAIEKKKTQLRVDALAGTVNRPQKDRYQQPTMGQTLPSDKPPVVINTLIPVEKISLRSNLAPFTWESLDEEVMKGKLYVVANGRYVYDISSWISSHPGGSIILYQVNGTDISNDYFHEAGFDADEFTPRKNYPEQRKDRANAKVVRQQSARNTAPGMARRGSAASHALSFTGSILDQMRMSPLVTESDWKIILKARRTHIHTDVALRRLATLVVGELVSSSSEVFDAYSAVTANAKFNNPSGRKFNKNEYRRYTLTDRKQITTSTAPGARQAYRLRFCLLYPHDIRNDEPLDFLPGQSIEIQVRLPDKRIVSRFYNPLSGNLSAFDIVVRAVPNGAVANYLIRQRPGDRQFKIRGPIGGVMLGPSRPLRDTSRASYVSNDARYVPEEWMPDVLFLFCAGSGVTPVLQLLSYLFLPALETLTATGVYTPQYGDEIQVYPGDQVVAKHHYFDGWCSGHNFSTNESGSFPLSITLPRFVSAQRAQAVRMGRVPPPKVVVVNSVNSLDELVGMESFEGSLLGYPEYIAVHHFVQDHFAAVRAAASVNPDYTLVSHTAPPLEAVPLPCGIVHLGKLRPDDVASIIQTYAPSEYMHGMDQSRNGSVVTLGEGSSLRVFMCGPVEYLRDLTDELNEVGLPTEVLKILPHDRPVEFF
ncbi:hypothetical protein BJ742DRAFT_770677 [Cladochytrium replicatum]|nr:hypothetical protein BJ742DRAFT_770677 [Cladochytrium replicatum]